MSNPIKVCGLTFVEKDSVPISMTTEQKCYKYHCVEVPLSLEVMEGYYKPYKVFPTEISLFKKNGPPGRDFYVGEEVRGTGESAKEAVESFFTAWNARLPAKVKELKTEVAELEKFHLVFNKNVKVVIEPTMEELKAEVANLKAKLKSKAKTK